MAAEAVLKDGKVDVGYMAYLPVALFGSVMGLTGIAVAWRLAHLYFQVPSWIGQYIGYVAIISLMLMTIGYAIKVVTAFDNVRAEFNHPVIGNLFGTPLISLLLVPILLAEVNLQLARVIWVVGVILMTAFAWLVVSRWMNTQQNVSHATPPWIVPVVGMIDIPLAVPALELDSVQGVMMFSLAVGLFFAIPLFTLVLSRLLFQEPVPPSIQPSLLILLAPFSVGFSSYVTTVGGMDAFAKALYMLMLFIFAVLAGRLRNLIRCCPFRVSWWSVSFPVAASAVASIRYAQYAHNVYIDGIAVCFLFFATVVVLGLLVRTVFGIARGELRNLSS